MRVDYVLPSQDLAITDAQVFWGTSDDPLFDLVGDFDPNVEPNGFPSSDHRLVYTDVKVEPEKANNDRSTVNGIDFLGEVNFETGLSFADTEVGGISGLTYDAANNIYYALSDDRFGGESGLINDTELFENGLQTFQEYNPLRDEFYGETGDEVTEGERKLYRFNRG